MTGHYHIVRLIHPLCLTYVDDLVIASQDITLTPPPSYKRHQFPLSPHRQTTTPGISYVLERASVFHRDDNRQLNINWIGVPLPDT